MFFKETFWSDFDCIRLVNKGRYHELVPNGGTLKVVTLFILTLVNTAVDPCYFNIA